MPRHSACGLRLRLIPLAPALGARVFDFVRRVAALWGHIALPPDVDGATSLPLASFVKGSGISIQFYSVLD